MARDDTSCKNCSNVRKNNDGNQSIKWLKRALLGIAGLVLLVFLLIYATSEYIIHKDHSSRPRELSLPESATGLAEGERLAKVFGCFGGCHGRDMEGDVAFDEPPFVMAVGPSLTDAVRYYSTREMEAMIRQGIRPDGRSVWIMPSGSFATMTDEHLGAILSFIAEYPVHERTPELPSTRFYLGGRVAILSGLIKAPAVLAAERQPVSMAALDDALSHGEYITMNACSECHGLDLQGFKDLIPPLVVAKGYNKEQFRRLMSGGVGLGDRDLGLMSEVAKARFSHLQSDEVDDLYDYLKSR